MHVGLWACPGCAMTNTGDDETETCNNFNSWINSCSTMKVVCIRGTMSYAKLALLYYMYACNLCLTTNHRYIFRVWSEDTLSVHSYKRRHPKTQPLTVNTNIII